MVHPHEDCYQTIKEQRLLKGFFLDLYELFYTQGPLTSAEVDELLDKEKRRGTQETSKRIHDLAQMGVVEDENQKHCAVSHRKNKVWRLTGKLPVRKENTETLKKKMERLEQFEKDMKAMVPDLIPLLRHMSFMKNVKASKGYKLLFDFVTDIDRD